MCNAVYTGADKGVTQVRGLLLQLKPQGLHAVPAESGPMQQLYNPQVQPVPWVPFQAGTSMGHTCNMWLEWRVQHSTDTCYCHGCAGSVPT
jgi:hypothetical protein